MCLCPLARGCVISLFRPRPANKRPRPPPAPKVRHTSFPSASPPRRVLSARGPLQVPSTRALCTPSLPSQPSVHRAHWSTPILTSIRSRSLARRSLSTGSAPVSLVTRHISEDRVGRGTYTRVSTLPFPARHRPSRTNHRPFRCAHRIRSRPLTPLFGRVPRATPKPRAHRPSAFRAQVNYIQPSSLITPSQLPVAIHLPRLCLCAMWPTSHLISPSMPSPAPQRTASTKLHATCIWSTRTGSAATALYALQASCLMPPRACRLRGRLHAY